MKKLIPIALVILSIIGCTEKPKQLNVGDIPFDPARDNPNFEVCNEYLIKQYYVRYSSDNRPGYKGEKKALVSEILSQYTPPVNSNQNGFITIRFLVNCHGETDRFRVESMDFDYNSIQFDKGIAQQLVSIIKELKGWLPRTNKNKSYDYYQYLTFKIEQGQIIQILP